MKKHVRIIYSVLLIVSIVCMFLPIARFEDDKDSDIWRRIEQADAKVSEIFTQQSGHYNRYSGNINNGIDAYKAADVNDAKAQKTALESIQKEMSDLYEKHKLLSKEQTEVDKAREELTQYENSEKLPTIYHALLPAKLPIPDNLVNFINADIETQKKIVSDSEKNQAYVSELNAILVKITDADEAKNEGNFSLAALELEDKIKELPSAVPFDAAKVSALVAEQKQVKSVRDQLNAVANVFAQKDEQGAADFAKVGKAVQSLIGIEKTQALLDGEDYTSLSTIKAQFDLLDAENAVTGQLASVTADTNDFSKVDEAIVKLSKQEAVAGWFESEEQNTLLAANNKIAALNALAGLLAKVPAENAAQAVETPKDLAKAVNTLLTSETMVKYFTEEEVTDLQALATELENHVVSEAKIENPVQDAANSNTENVNTAETEEQIEETAEKDEKNFKKFPQFVKKNDETIPLVFDEKETQVFIDTENMSQEELQETANKLKADFDALLTKVIDELQNTSSDDNKHVEKAKKNLNEVKKWQAILDANCEKGELLDTTIERYQRLIALMDTQLLINEKLAVVNEKLAATVDETEVVNPWDGLDTKLAELTTILTGKQAQLQAELVENDFVALNTLVAEKAAQETEALQTVVPGIEEVILRNDQQATLDTSVAAVVAEVNNIKAMCADGGALAAFVASEQTTIDAANAELERLDDEWNANEAIQDNSAFLLDRDVIVKLTANEGIEGYTGLTLDMELINQNKQVYPVQFGTYNVLVWVAFAMLVLALVLVWVPGNKIVSKCYTFASFANIIGIVVLCYVVLRLGGIPVGINYSNPIMNSWVVLFLLVPPVIALLMHCSTVTNTKRSMLYVLCTALCILSLMPFWLMIVNATRNSQQIMGGVSLLPSTFLNHNWGVLQSKNFDVMVGFKNSAIIAFGSTLLSVYFSALTAYGLTVYKFKGSKALYALILGIIMIPGQVTGTGFYMFMFQLGWTNSYWPLIIPAIASASTVFFFKQYLEANFQVSLVEAARIDGAGEFYTYNKIVMPIMIPAMATMGIMAVIGSWNNYLTPLMLLSDPTMKTLPMMVKELRGDIYRTEYGSIYLGLTLTALPLIIVYFCLSKYIIAGVAVGGVKE